MYVASDATALLSFLGIPRLKTTARVEWSPDGINSHISVTKVTIQVAGHQLWFNLERDGLCLFYLPKIHYV